MMYCRLLSFLLIIKPNPTMVSELRGTECLDDSVFFMCLMFYKHSFLQPAASWELVLELLAKESKGESRLI